MVNKDVYITSLNTLRYSVFELRSRQKTDRQTNRTKRLIPTPRIGVGRTISIIKENNKENALMIPP